MSCRFTECAVAKKRSVAECSVSLNTQQLLGRQPRLGTMMPKAVAKTAAYEDLEQGKKRDREKQELPSEQML